MIKTIYLDSRIKNVSDIQSPVRYDDSFIGEVCYFANNMREFEDLESCSKGTLSEYIDDSYSELGSFTAKEFEGDEYYDFFIPEKLLNPVEKKYRPFTLAEWIDRHEIGEVIHYRSKSEEMELRQMYVGTRHSQGIKNIIVKITLGNESHTLDYLFENYEIEVDGEWKPFGVLDE